ncbi:transaldolase [Sporosarcina sp. ANT_H38]|uniref:transaldolase family protein n=1 Tax=Sporosarcina sp. ANT_H38 TaxID=2597358 RepID=UPI0011F36979|nr:transaldolase family protein [Sporosarcina sp. ANT_H38]KAA0966375.1 transaldolase [Sporosarcina sp. ANT_H38]
MKYLIDSTNELEIAQALEMGVVGVTANPTLYAKGNVNYYEFIKKYSKKNILLTAEVIGTDFEEMVDEVNLLTEISNGEIIIKLNYSALGLKLANYLHQKGIKTAMTLVFDVNQAMLSLNANADYLFLFVARNEELGIDGLEFVRNVSTIIQSKGYEAKVVASSIRTKFQLQEVALYADYIAVPFQLIDGSFHHPLTILGVETFEIDMKKVLEVD